MVKLVIVSPDYRQYSAECPFSLREKVAEGRMRGQKYQSIKLFPLTLTLSLRERGLC
jgi:hypothetical protein